MARSLGAQLGMKERLAPQAASVVSIPDVHGDLQALQSALQLANLTDARHNWRAPAGTVLVQTGDLFDRGDDTKAIVSLLQTIEVQAAAAGSTVHRLLGNHDVMNLMGDLRYVTPGDFASFGGHAARAASFARDGPIGAWLLRARICVHVGDTLFVHAGIAERFAALGCDQINAYATQGSNPSPADRPQTESQASVPDRSAPHTCEPRLGQARCGGAGARGAARPLLRHPRARRRTYARGGGRAGVVPG